MNPDRFSAVSGGGLLRHVLQGPAAQEFDHHQHVAAVLEHVVDGHNVRMLLGREMPGLVQHFRTLVCGVRQAPVQAFDGNFAVQLGVAGAEHFPRPAASDFLLQPIPTHRALRQSPPGKCASPIRVSTNEPLPSLKPSVATIPSHNAW
jgi:hypothetical protein